MTTHNLQLLEEFPGKVFRCEDHKVVESNSEILEEIETSETLENQ